MFTCYTALSGGQGRLMCSSDTRAEPVWRDGWGGGGCGLVPECMLGACVLRVMQGPFFSRRLLAMKPASVFRRNTL